MLDISCSIVLFHNPISEITKAIDSFLNCAKNVRLFLVDNSSDDSFRYIFGNIPRVDYIYNGRNLGYGTAHNIAVQKAVGLSRYHLVLNPDVEFDPSVINRLFKFMEQHDDIGLIMPKILYNNGDMQYLCKMLPSPVDLFIRRFIPGPFKFLFKKMLDTYELKNKDYDAIMETPNLSGCFMFIKTEIFKELGMFDERYFLYLEDTDLCRRINERYRTIYYPRVSIIHGYSKASYKSLKLMKLHLTSSIKYFNKWGWFNDKSRNTINRSVQNNSYTLMRKIPALSSVSNVSNNSLTLNINSGEVEVHDLTNISVR